ncbi:uncharacterized protein BDV17DRAFT_272500 [Aspergillus undulatus]|uniref:uncharacterized protein n=1 Tax=Aspergillus undulatus TaxID=1810928 RepID=UPI003CCE2447
MVKENAKNVFGLGNTPFELSKKDMTAIDCTPCLREDRSQLRRRWKTSELHDAEEVCPAIFNL